MSKRYHQFCGVAKALDVVGERWTLLIVRDLLLGGRRYSDLLHSMPGLTTNLLARRLETMMQHGLIARRTLPAPAKSTVYELTELGRGLEPVVLALGAFGARYLDRPDADDRIDPRWAMVSLKRRYRGSPRRWVLALHVSDAPFGVTLGDERLDVHDGAPRRPDAVISGPPQAWLQLLSGAVPARTLVERGALVRDGPARALSDFARCVGARA